MLLTRFTTRADGVLAMWFFLTTDELFREARMQGQSLRVTPGRVAKFNERSSLNL